MEHYGNYCAPLTPSQYDPDPQSVETPSIRAPSPMLCESSGRVNPPQMLFHTHLAAPRHYPQRRFLSQQGDIEAVEGGAYADWLPQMPSQAQDDPSMPWPPHMYPSRRMAASQTPRLPNDSPTFGQGLGQPLAVDAMAGMAAIPLPLDSILAWEDADKFIIPQTTYGRESSDYQPPVPLTVNVLLCEALALSSWPNVETALQSAFQDPQKLRKNQKFTCRFCFQDLPQNENPRQMRDYTSGRRRQHLAQRLTHAGKLAGLAKELKPVSTIELVDMIASTLKEFMRILAQKGAPLTFRHQIVKYEHVELVAIRRPTRAAVQPVLAIHPCFRHMYPARAHTTTRE